VTRWARRTATSGSPRPGRRGASDASEATLGPHEPLRGQLRIALRAGVTAGVTKEEVVGLFIHLAACAGAARAFDRYQDALAVFAEAASGLAVAGEAASCREQGDDLRPGGGGRA
jgi:hypothetical protein